jgi:hypothetical protein
MPLAETNETASQWMAGLPAGGEEVHRTDCFTPSIPPPISPLGAGVR